MKSIVVIHTGGLGDFVQTFPVLSAMRRKWPDAGIVIVGRSERAQLAVAGGLADEVAEAETCGLHRLFVPGTDADALPPALRDADLILNFLDHETLNDNLSRLSSADVVPACSFPAPGACDRPAAQFVYNQVAGRLGLPPSEAMPRLRLPAALPMSDEVAERFADSAQAMAVHPGSGSPKKNWPLERFVGVSQRLADDGLSTVWLLGPAELERAEFAALAATERCLAGADLVTVAALLNRVRVYVGSDSGVTHLAAALGAPTVALFGPSERAVWAPRGENVRTLVAPGGRMVALAVGDVLHAVTEALARQAEP